MSIHYQSGNTLSLVINLAINFFPLIREVSGPQCNRNTTILGFKQVFYNTVSGKAIRSSCIGNLSHLWRKTNAVLPITGWYCFKTYRDTLVCAAMVFIAHRPITYTVVNCTKV